MMHFRRFMIFSVCLTVSGLNSFSQTRYSNFSVEKKMQDTFSFAKKWDYSWKILRSNTGKFTKNDSGPLLPGDTAHLFYTANCSTNVQGGYAIRYCVAERNKNMITLKFSDGLPAYASEFFVYLKGNGFTFKPMVVYPMYITGQRLSYEVTKQKLTLNNNQYKKGDIIMGYLDMEFTETVSVPKKETIKHTFHLKGYIRTPLKNTKVNR